MIDENKPPIVCVDKRELRSDIAKHLEKMGADVRYKTLDVADYVLSDRVAVERKRADDFMASFLGNHKIFGQLYDFSRAYSRPLLIVEGAGYVGDDLFYSNNVRPEPLHALLNTIAISYRIPTRYTLNSKESAEVMFAIADREQNHVKRPFQLHGKRSHFTQTEWMEYIISAFDGVGRGTGQKLLAKHCSLIKTFNKSLEELQDYKGINKPAMLRFHNLLHAEYKK